MLGAGELCPGLVRVSLGTSGIVGFCLGQARYGKVRFGFRKVGACGECQTIVNFILARLGLLGFIEFGLKRYEQGRSSVVGFRLTMVRDGQGC